MKLSAGIKKIVAISFSPCQGARSFNSSNGEKVMGENSGNSREISLGDDFGAVVVKVNGARIEVGADSHIIVRTRGGVELQPAADDDRSSAAVVAPKPGDRMADGTVFAGISPDTGKPMYATPKDAPLTMKWKQAMEYAGKLDAHGHKDWRVPTKRDLKVLFQNRDMGKLRRTFNETGYHPAGWYWSSTQYVSVNAWAQRFRDGHQDYDYKNFNSSLRCVR
jgi:hypothetical protein